MNGQSPQLPFVWFDFNACGWVGNGDPGNCTLGRKPLAAIAARKGMRVFLYDTGEPGTIPGASLSFSGLRLALPLAGARCPLPTPTTVILRQNIRRATFPSCPPPHCLDPTSRAHEKSLLRNYWPRSLPGILE